MVGIYDLHEVERNKRGREHFQEWSEYFRGMPDQAKQGVMEYLRQNSNKIGDERFYDDVLAKVFEMMEGQPGFENWMNQQGLDPLSQEEQSLFDDILKRQETMKSGTSTIPNDVLQHMLEQDIDQLTRGNVRKY